MFQDTMKTMHKQWNQLTERQKAPYERLAASDADRYRREVRCGALNNFYSPQNGRSRLRYKYNTITTQEKNKQTRHMYKLTQKYCALNTCSLALLSIGWSEGGRSRIVRFSKFLNALVYLLVLQLWPVHAQRINTPKLGLISGFSEWVQYYPQIQDSVKRNFATKIGVHCMCTWN